MYRAEIEDSIVLIHFFRYIHENLKIMKNENIGSFIYTFDTYVKLIVRILSFFRFKMSR